MSESVHVPAESLDAYVDGALGDEEAERVAAHVARCPTCSKELDVLMATIGTMRDALPRYSAPDTLQQRIRSAVRAETSQTLQPTVPSAAPARAAMQMPAWTWPRASWMRAAVAGIAIAVMSAAATYAVARGNGTSRTVEDLEASHVRSLMLDHLVDVRSTDRHQVKPWFSGKLDYAPTIPNVDTAGFPLIGGRLDFVAGRRVAVAAYKRRQHIINLYAWPSSDSDDGVERERDGYHFIRWRGDGAEHWAVSDVGVEDLRAFVRVVRRQAEAGR